jgi:hypothetical protein
VTNFRLCDLAAADEFFDARLQKSILKRARYNLPLFEGVKMPSALHRGVVQPNGRVDPCQAITDPAGLTVRLADDALRLTSLEIGNFEWWYFDVIDARNGYVLKLIAHLGTNPLRTTFSPTVAVAAWTPRGRKVARQTFDLNDFQASRESCNVTIKDAWHVSTDPGPSALTYHLTVNLPAFRATLRFRSHLAGWKPLGDVVPMQQGSKRATFLWVVPMPRAEVEGTFSLDGVDYKLDEALGYHDHNAWQVAPRAKLFLDKVIAYWYWGRFLGREATIVFMETGFRTHCLRSCLLALGSTVVHSSNNLVEVTPEEVTHDAPMRVTYPTRMTVTLAEASCPLQMVLKAKAVLDRRDLLEGMQPLLKWCIRGLISQPTYHGILADATVRLYGEEIHGAALYESMCLRCKARGLR